MKILKSLFFNRSFPFFALIILLTKKINKKQKDRIFNGRLHFRSERAQNGLKTLHLVSQNWLIHRLHSESHYINPVYTLKEFQRNATLLTKAIKIINILVGVGPQSIGVKWAITLVDIKVFQKACWNPYTSGYIVSA